MFESSQYLEEIERLGKAEGSRSHLPPWLSFLGLSLVTTSRSHLSWPLSCTHPLQSVSKSQLGAVPFYQLCQKGFCNSSLRCLTLSRLSDSPYCLGQTPCSLCGPSEFHIWAHSDPQRDWKTNCKERSVFTICLFICLYQLRVRSDLPCLLHLVLTTYH